MNNIYINDLIDNVDAIIFDMDGTLIDSLYVWGEIDVEFLGKYNIDPPDDYQPLISGMSFYQVAEYTKNRFNIPESIEEIMDIWNEMAEEKYEKEVTYKPGAESFLKKCVQNGLKLGIATSNSRHLVDKMIDKLHLNEYMTAIITGDEVVNGKPAPDVYLKAASEIGVEPTRCLVFEDVLAGINAGHNAGMKVCAVYDDLTKDCDDEKRRLAEFYIHDYTELIIED